MSECVVEEAVQGNGRYDDDDDDIWSRFQVKTDVVHKLMQVAVQLYTLFIVYRKDNTEVVEPRGDPGGRPFPRSDTLVRSWICTIIINLFHLFLSIFSG